MTRRLLVLLRFEARKLWARRLPRLAFLVVVLVALLAPRAGHLVDTASSLVKGRTAAADPFRNGWTALAGAVSTARLFLVILLLVLAGSSVAEEAQQGTLKALFVRPVRRLELLLAKALATWGYAVALLLVAVAAAALGAELQRGLYDVADPDFPDRVKHYFPEMVRYVALATALTALPLLALTGLGLLCSTLFDHAGHATGAAVGALFLLSGLAGLGDGAREWLFVSYLSLPFEVVQDIANQYTNAAAPFRPERIARAVEVSLGWSVLLLGASAALLQRRDVS